MPGYESQFFIVPFALDDITIVAGHIHYPETTGLPEPVIEAMLRLFDAGFP